MKKKPKKILYREWGIKWLEYKKDYIKESTYANYSNIMYNHLIPDFNTTNLSDINHEMLQDYILKKLNHGSIDNSSLSQKSVKDIMMVLKNSLKYAMNLQIIPQVNLEFKYPKINKKSKIYILSKREQKKITQYILEKPTPRSIGILISLYSGMRIGEICALKWSDIDLKNNIIHVNKTLQRVYLKDSNNDITSSIVVSTS